MQRKKNGSLLNRLFIALALFVVLPVLIMVSMSDIALMSAISDEIGKAGIGKLKVATSIDQMITELAQNTCVRIAMDPALEKLSKIRQFSVIQGSGSIQYDFMQFQNDLGEVIRTNSLFDSIHISLEDADWIISTVDGTVGRQNFSDHLWLKSILDNKIADNGAALLLPHIPVPVNSITGRKSELPRDDQVITLVYPLTAYITNVRGLMLLNIKEREFSRRINSSNYGSEGSILVLDSSGNVISNVDRSLVGASFAKEPFFRQIMAQQLQEGYLVSSGKQSDHLISWFKPDGDDRIFVGDFSLGELTRSVGTVRLATVGISVLLLLIGVVLSYLVSVRFFNPVRKLLQEIHERAGVDGLVEGNEMTLLSSAFEVLLRRENQLFSIVERNLRQYNEGWVLRGIKGALGEAGFDDRPERLVGKHLMAGLLAVDGRKDFNQRVDPDRREYLRSLILHMAEEAFLPQISCIGALTEDRGIVLILASDLDDRAAVREILDRGFKVLGPEAERAIQTSVTLCVGSRSTLASGLDKSWGEAQDLLKRRFSKGPGHLFWAEDEAEPGAVGFYPRREERRILAALEAGNQVELRQGVASLGQAIRERPGLSHDNSMLIFVQLVAGIVKHLIELNIGIAELFGPNTNLHAELADTETLDEALAWLQGVLEKVARQGHQTRQDERQHAKAMIDFIRENYHKDFGIETVADHVGLSYSHARKVFQDELGDSIVNYVNSLRVTEAQRLLVDSSKNLDSIARSLGYNNSQSFNRYFKKYTGQTPGEYRAQRRQV